MIKNIIENNEQIELNSREMKILRENFAGCFSVDGKFDLEKFKSAIADKVDFTKEGYELNFLGKSYGKMLSAMQSTTVIVPDVEHNSKPENKDSENIFISGDNLDALQHLRKSYAGEIKCVYIDPPYNTGSDEFVYKDKFSFTKEELVEKLSIDEKQAERLINMTSSGSKSHSAWMTFMLPRLLIAKDLLSKDGVIFISIDDNEQAQLKCLCNDVFGEENFLACVSRATGTPTGGGFDGLVNELDYLLIYAKNISFAVINGMEMDEKAASIYTEIDEDGKKYLTRSLRRTGGEDRREDRPTMYYPIIAPDGTKIFPIGPTGYESRWICAPAKVTYLIDNNLLEWKKTIVNNQETWHPYQKYYLENRTKKPGNIWYDFTIENDFENPYLWNDIDGNKKATREIRELFYGNKVFETAKPLALIERIINIACTKNEIVLDFFGGSSTTAHALMNTNINKKNKYIIVQLPEKVKVGSIAENEGYKTIDEIGIKRIKLAAKKIKEENPNADIDFGFKHFTLKEPCEKALDKCYDFDASKDLDGIDLLEEFGIDTILSTWANMDGYKLNPKIDVLNFAGYEAYMVGKHIYLLKRNMSNESILEFVKRCESDSAFNPETVVIFGYSFGNWSSVETLKANIKQLNNTKKNMQLNFLVRY